MKVLSFVEGANTRRGGLGLVGVPEISKSVADRGHQVVLNVGGRVNPGAEQFVQPDVKSALRLESGAGTFGIVTYANCGDWAFSPAMLWALRSHLRDIDFISLHSLYSFPVLMGYLLARIYRKPYGLWPHGVLAPFQRFVHWRRKWVDDQLIGRRILDEANVLFYSGSGERAETKHLNI